MVSARTFIGVSRDTFENYRLSDGEWKDTATGVAGALCSHQRYRLYKIGWEKTKSVRRIAAILFDVQVYTSIVLSATCLVGAPDSKDLLCVSYVIIISKAATN